MPRSRMLLKGAQTFFQLTIWMGFLKFRQFIGRVKQGNIVEDEQTVVDAMEEIDDDEVVIEEEEIFLDQETIHDYLVYDQMVCINE